MTADTVNRKGTPGPWGIEKTKNDWWVGQLGPDGKVDLIVARFPTGSEYSETYTDRQKSDAQLVAISPDLLDAAKEALSVLRSASRQLSEDHRLVLGGRGWGWRTIAKLEGLIAKAEGRS